jgi:hypothetical protein
MDSFLQTARLKSPRRKKHLSKIPMYESPESPIPVEDAGQTHCEGGIAQYKCKVYRTLLSITSDSHCKRPLVMRFGRRNTADAMHAGAR